MSTDVNADDGKTLHVCSDTQVIYNAHEQTFHTEYRQKRICSDNHLPSFPAKAVKGNTMTPYLSLSLLLHLNSPLLLATVEQYIHTTLPPFIITEDTLFTDISSLADCRGHIRAAWTKQKCTRLTTCDDEVCRNKVILFTQKAHPHMNRLQQMTFQNDKTKHSRFQYLYKTSGQKWTPHVFFVLLRPVCTVLLSAQST